MRVIAGSARRLLLKTPEGMDTRPTTDRIKETLFNMLMPNLPGAVFVDLFSGSGGIGIEALSRGAAKAYFVESSPKAVACITDNVEHTHFTDKAVILKQDVFAAIRGSIRDTADVVFLDPPYNQEYDKRVLELLKDALFVSEDTLIVVEAALKTEFDYVQELGFAVEKEKCYKTSKHVFIRKCA
ncbi:16S rRNA (guanine(966)-N(2))-methyltransferase RsmD [Lachnospiraceae bacterium MD335]|jgi:16S rRNA (guanine966-N2)-methyltransferase|nr:16S rRNA (guanine(966)-N(2))-methyltransferase RsmD [Lachnospiraceae bacterium MD335]